MPAGIFIVFELKNNKILAGKFDSSTDAYACKRIHPKFQDENTAKKLTKKCDVHPKLWLCVVKLFFFDVLVAVASLDLSFDRCSQWGGSFDG